MTWPLLLAVLAGCRTSTPPIVEGPPRPFDQPGGAPMVRLDRMPMRIQLQAPQGTPPPVDYALTDLQRRDNWDGNGGILLRAAIPFDTEASEEDPFGTEGIAITLGTQELPRAKSVAPKRPAPYYVLESGWVTVALPPGTNIEGLSAHNRLTDSHLRRLDPERSGLSAEDYVHYTHTEGDYTRHGLLLPAGSSLQWSVEIPAQGRFVTTGLLLPTHIAKQRSDGAALELVLAEGDTERVISKLELEPSTLLGLTLDAHPEAPWEVDLSPWAGKTVSLTLRGTTLHDPQWDSLLAISPRIIGRAEAPPRRVVVVGLDTTRPDRFGTYGSTLGATDALDAYFARRGAVFEEAWAPAPRTRPSFRTATTGRLPLDAVGAQNLGDVFAANGFATAGVVANIHLNPRFDFDVGFDDWWLHEEASATDQVNNALAWLRDHADQDSFLFLHLMDPHLTYTPPSSYASRFVQQRDPTMPPVFNRWTAGMWKAAGELTPARQANVEGLYAAEIAYTTDELARFLGELESMGDNTLVIVHSDHGEELWDHGGFEHNHTLYEETTHAALWVQPPGGTPGVGLRSDEPVWLADIAPTLYEYAALEHTPPTDGRSLKPLLEGSGGSWDRPLPLGYLMYDTERWGVVYRGHKYILQTASGEQELYDLQADPDERTNLADKTDLAPYWRALGEAHKMPVGPGWRLDVSLSRDTLVLVLPVPCEDAGVIDPEAALEHRANFAWGQAPTTTRDDVATVERSADGRRLTLRRGKVGRGTLWVRFPQEVPVQFDVEDAAGKRLGGTSRGALRLRVRGDSFVARPGVVVDTPPTEAARLRATEGGASDQETCNLCALGYLTGPSCEDC